MAHIHQKGVCHRDFKLENILLSADFTFKIADFGFSAAIEGRQGNGLRDTILGTPGYMAPEIVEARQYSGRSVDIYALGVILFAMVTKAMPFRGIRAGDLSGRTLLQVDLLYQIFNVDKTTYWNRFPQVSAELR